MGELSVTVSAWTDQFDRRHRDLRVSLTDRCSLRCTYCLPEMFSEWPQPIAARFQASVHAKAAGHGIDDPAFLQPARPMSAIGG